MTTDEREYAIANRESLNVHTTISRLVKMHARVCVCVRGRMALFVCNRAQFHQIVAILFVCQYDFAFDSYILFINRILSCK